ncbi:MAG: hypothetical protein QME51_00520 [Planctomycetota bacterium]|nr:hypothetical protein [Planctomycetota bacterium]MDI6786843.1 hypothetical protein [Planctomycetota bacterium]
MEFQSLIEIASADPAPIFIGGGVCFAMTVEGCHCEEWRHRRHDEAI